MGIVGIVVSMGAVAFKESTNTILVILALPKLTFAKISLVDDM